jgi:hypothetical protein
MYLVILFLEYSAVENQPYSPFLAAQLNLGHYFINFFSYYPPMQKTGFSVHERPKTI